jgi:hypothetical protein
MRFLISAIFTNKRSSRAFAIAMAITVDGTRYGTDHERYCISGIVRLSDLAEHPHPIPRYHLSPEYAREKTAVQYRLRAEKWEPTLNRNRLTAGITSNEWMCILRRDNVRLEDGRHYPVLEIPKNVDVKIEKGTALLAVLRSSVNDLPGLSSSAKWCIVDFLLCGKQESVVSGPSIECCVQMSRATNTRQHQVSMRRSVLI